MPLVERRYAEALVDISLQEGALDVYQQQLTAIADAFNSQDDFKLFLLNPQVKAVVKKEVVSKAFSDRVKPGLLNFLMLLIDRGRIKYLPGIRREFISLADKKRNVLNMIITSAAPLEQSQVEEIKEKYREMYNASEVKVEVSVDSSLIGGIKVQIGDRIIDATIKGRLEDMKSLITQ